MFTKEQIETVHNQVKSGADFPKYVEDIMHLGVKSHEVVLSDGIWIFKCSDEQAVHQKGETDYPTFCFQAGESGVERWISDFERMTVTYLDSNGDVIDVEPVPHA